MFDLYVTIGYLFTFQKKQTDEKKFYTHHRELITI